MRRLHPTLMIAVLGGWLAGAAALGQLPRDLIEQALDQRVEDITLENMPIPDALKALEEKTGLRFELHPAVAELLPYGGSTRINLTIRQTSVRDGLTRAFEALGLAMEVQGDKIAIVPAPFLDRLGRRLNAEESALIEKLAREPWSKERASIEFRVPPDAKPGPSFEQAMAQMQGPSALRQLEAATRTLGWVWRPEDGRIVIEPLREDLKRRLDWPLDLTYQREPLDKVLVDLGARIGVTMMFEPGVLKQIDARDRNVDLVQRGVSVRQTLERICGNTGLRYEVVDEGVRISGPLPRHDDAGPAAAGIVRRPRSGGPADDVDLSRFVRLAIEVRPGVTMDVFLRTDQLPPDLRQDCERKLGELLGTSKPAANADGQ